MIRTYRNYESTFESGINSDESRKKRGTKVIDDKLSFGEACHAYEYRKDDQVVGYFLMGRTKNLMVMYSIMSNHIAHHDYIKILKERIHRINMITAPDAMDESLRKVVSE
jgi:hypothetical protein